MLFHYPERPLHLSEDRERNSTSAIWSRTPNRQAVIFVHGYGGNAIATWTEFHKLLPQSPGFEQYDLIFYGHNGLYATTNASAILFYQFLDQLFSHPPSIINASLPFLAARPANFEYERFVIVAHSLGAVICRWALLYAHEKGADWLNKTGMVFFAPAHMGAKVVQLVQEAAIGTFGILAAYWRFKSPLIDELKEGSALLQTLRERTVHAIQTGYSPYLVAKQVVIAEKDRIVSNLPFPFDPPALTLPGTSHCSVCKPHINFLDPIDILSKAL